MKIHGNIEAGGDFQTAAYFVHSIHGWKSMATLKHKPEKEIETCKHCIHGWKSMATLKQWRAFLTSSDVTCIHGWKSMATLKLPVWSRWRYRKYCSIHGWKSMATLKHDSISLSPRSSSWVSMDENPWQHWSLEPLEKLGISTAIGIHGWKSMATLKRCIYPHPAPATCRIHGWKSMATLKHLCPARASPGCL